MEYIYEDANQKEIKPIKRNYPKRNWLEKNVFKDEFEVLVGDWTMPRHTWEKRTMPAVKSINSIIGKAPIKIVSKDKESYELDSNTGLIMPPSKKWCFDPQTKLFLIAEEQYAQYKYELIYLEPTMVCKRRTETFNYWKQHEDWGGFFIYGLNELPMKSTIIYLNLVYPEWQNEYVLLRERFKQPRLIDDENGYVVVNCNYCLKEDLQKAYDELKSGNENVMKFFKDNLWTHYQVGNEKDKKRMLEDLHASINNEKLESVVLLHTWAGSSREEKELLDIEQKRLELGGAQTVVIKHEELEKILSQEKEKQKNELDSFTKERLEERFFGVGYSHPLKEQWERNDWGQQTEKMKPVMEKLKKQEEENQKIKEEKIRKEIEEKIRREYELKYKEEMRLKKEAEEYKGPITIQEIAAELPEHITRDMTFEEKLAYKYGSGANDYKAFQEERGLIELEEEEEEDFFDEEELKNTSLKITEDVQKEFLEITNEKNFSEAILRKVKEEEENPIKIKPFEFFINYYENNRTKEEKRVKIKFPLTLGEDLTKKYNKPLNTVLNAHILRVVLEDRGMLD